MGLATTSHAARSPRSSGPRSRNVRSSASLTSAASSLVAVPTISASVMSAIDASTRCGSGSGSPRVRLLGTATLVIPAACAARSPFGESSNTRHEAGSTSIRSAASRNRSGAGLTCWTSSRVQTASKSGINSCRSSHGCTHADGLLDATARPNDSVARLVDALANAGQQRLLAAEPPVLVAHEAGEGVAVERRCQRRAQVRERVEAALGAQRMLPVVHRQRDAVTRVDRGPDVEQGRLAVDDQAVEVEDECARWAREIRLQAAGYRLQACRPSVWPKRPPPVPVACAERCSP